LNALTLAKQVVTMTSKTRYERGDIRQKELGWGKKRGKEQGKEGRPQKRGAR